MTMLRHHNPDGLHRSPAYSQAVEVSSGARILFIGGQNGIDEAGLVVGDTVAAQTRQAPENTRIAVEAAGGTIADVAKWTVLLTDGSRAHEGFAAFAEFWNPDVPPPAITVQVVVALANPDFLVEIEATAALPG